MTSNAATIGAPTEQQSTHPDTPGIFRRIGRQWRRLAWVVVGVGLVVFLFSTRAVVITALSALTWRAWPAIVAGSVLSGFAMVNGGMKSHASHRAMGIDIDLASITRTSLVGNTANRVVRSGGALGVAVFVRRGRDRGAAAGAVLGACVLSSAASYVSLVGAFTGVVAFVYWSGQLEGWWYAAIVGLSLYTIGVVSLAVVVRYGSGGVQRWLDRLGRVRPTRRARSQSVKLPSLDNFAAAFAAARQQPRWIARAVAHAFASKVIGASILLVALRAVGVQPSASQLVILYTTGLTAGFVSFAPGGLGVVEATYVTAIVSGGVDVATATAAVAIFRVFDMWLPVIVGAGLGRGELGRVRRSPGLVAVPSPPTPTVERPQPRIAARPLVGVASVVADVERAA